MKNLCGWAIATGMVVVAMGVGPMGCSDPDMVGRPTFGGAMEVPVVAPVTPIAPVGPVAPLVAEPGRVEVAGPAMSFLRAKGSDIVDDKGEKIMLRGVGLGNWMLPEGYMWHFGDQGDRPRRIEKVVSGLLGEEEAGRFWKAYRAEYISEKDIARIAELGFNCVRVVMDAKFLMSEEDGHFLPEGFGLIENVVRWSRAHGLYVILDLHAAPGGQTGLNIDDSVDDQPRLFMGEKKYEERLTALWVELAKRYRDEPAVAMYDLLNEPLPKRTGAEDKYKQLLEPMYKRVTAAIRVVDKKHIVTVEGSNFANDLDIFGPPFDDNLVYQFHYYCRANPTELKPLGSYLTPGRKLGAPLWVGETGERDAAIYWGTTEWLERENIGWCFWPWKKMGADNGLYSVKLPAEWGRVAAVSEGKKSDLTQVEAKKIFDELLTNIRLENCEYNEADANALMHRVPARVEGENFGKGGMNVSYFVKDEKTLAKFYRKNEPVQIEQVEGGGRRNGMGQAIRMQVGEWVVYDVNAQEERDYAVSVRINKGVEGASFRISANGANADGSQRAAIVSEGWHVVKMNPVHLKKGANVIKVTDMSGSVGLDWMEVR